MKAGDVCAVLVLTGGEWRCRVVRKAAHGAWLVEWLTGPLAGREARVGGEFLSPVAEGR